MNGWRMDAAGDKADPALSEAERALGIFISDIPMAPEEQISWRVATHPILYEAYEGGPFVSAKGIHYPRDCLEIKYVAGNTLLAASDKGQASDSLKQTLTLLPQPRKHDRFMELKNRRRIKNSLLIFVSAEGSFSKSLNWQPIEDGSGIQINELDSDIMDMVKDESAEPDIPRNP